MATMNTGRSDRPECQRLLTTATLTELLHDGRFRQVVALLSEMQERRRQNEIETVTQSARSPTSPHLVFRDDE